MAKPQTHKPAAAQDAEGRKRPGSKLAFIGKVVVFFMTFGFAFPTIFGE